MNRPASIALVDLSYLFKKRYVTTTDGVPFSAAKKTLQDLENLKRGVAHLIICRDRPPYKRKELFADYKAGRPEPEPEEMAQRKYLANALKGQGFNVAMCEGYEADDIIATLAKSYGEWCGDVRIVGPDKDMAQCITANVVQYIPPHGEKDWQIRDVKAVRDKWGVEPHEMPFWQALAGDSGDNIPGVPGIGPKKATDLVRAHRTLGKLAEDMATAASIGGPKPAATVAALVTHWDSLALSLRLVTLATDVPIDAESFLEKRAPEPPQRERMAMADIEIDGFVGNETPAPQPPEEPVKPSAVYPAAQKAYAESRAANDAPAAAKDAEFEEQYDRERSKSGEHDTVSPRRAEPVELPRQQQQSTALAVAPAYSQHHKYGLSTTSLQPLDLVAARNVSVWICDSGLYQQFKTPEAVFCIIARGKELGLGMTTALAGFHMVEGKPSASADLIRALVERDPNFEYLMPVEMSATRVVWEGKHKRQPKAVQYTYTIQDAEKAGLVRLGNYAGKGNWYTRPQDMLVKTGGSKLARLLWPGATLGLYCPEEMGFGEEELTTEVAA